MADARQKHDWSMTSSLMALIANAHRDPKKHRPFKPADFDPSIQSQARSIRAGVGVLRDVFIDRRVPPAKEVAP
jgi:hypothetical protein